MTLKTSRAFVFGKHTCLPYPVHKALVQWSEKKEDMVTLTLEFHHPEDLHMYDKNILQESGWKDHPYGKFTRVISWSEYKNILLKCFDGGRADKFPTHHVQKAIHAWFKSED